MQSLYRALQIFIYVLLLSLAKSSWINQEEEAPHVNLQTVDYSNEDDELNSTIVPGSSKKLTEYLLSRHNVNSAPDGLINIYYELELVHILGIDELKQTMTVLIYVDERWTDPSLQWEPALFGGITKTWLPMDKIWVPDVIIFNMLNHEDLLASVRAPVLVYPNGTIEASHPAVHTVSCEINIKHFPLDDQRCALEVASWAYGKDKIRLHAHTEHSLEHYTDNEEWHLLNVNVSEREYIHEGINVSELRYDVSVKRRPLFYMVTLTFPSYVMCAISVVGLFARFSTTGEREERFTLGVTAILTMAVLSLVVSEKVPHSSTHVPLLVAYFLFNMVVVSVAAMTTGIVMRVHRMGRFGREPHNFWMKVFCLRPNRLAAPKKRAYRVKIVDTGEQSVMLERINGDVNQPQNQTVNLNGPIQAPQHDHFSLHKRIEALEEYIRKMVSRCEHMQEELDEWDCLESLSARKRREDNGYVRISQRLDLVFMAFFLFIVTVPVIVLFSLT
ncbi:hypothetical protein WR25_08888 [Diploscapter pachys]|uniref:Neurotransmitter-gated ion-channel ligand-binding domain-containing protein n=1 Tax=Diploscapter pachys TaxID=2018661 RepID=A0A2A2JBC4_9BILA|nr:hypothetical protein WR25_08888 [Diploscapter pachys]